MDSAGDAGPPAAWTVPGYRHDRELGSGASGRVVLAHHGETGTAVAIKYLVRSLHAAPDFRAAYRAEAGLLGELHSPHLARLYEYVESEYGAAIVMELVEGVSLRSLLRAEGATSPEAALVVLKGSLLGLAAAHGAGVVHRDYKPENVLVTPQGVSKLVDFGIAARSGAVGVAAGTPLYMAPEQFAGQPAAPAADVYAATATFFECVTGAQPYSGTTAMELMIQHTESPIPDELAPERLRPLIRAGLAKSPGERPASAAAFVDELEHVAVAVYGDDWEERGRRKLATLLALLPLLLLKAPSEFPSGTTALATTDLGSGGPSARRAGNRVVKAVVGTGAAVLVIAGVAAIASAANESGTHPAAAGYGATTGATTLVTPTQSTGPAPVAAATAGSPTPSGSPSASPSAAAAQMTPSPTPPTASPQSSATATTTKSSTPSPSPSPVLRVTSVAITSSGCWGKQGLQAIVEVKSDGAAAGTLYLTWYYTATNGGPRTVVATDSVSLPKGKTDVINSNPYYHTFSAGAYWGLGVSTSPAAVRGDNSVKTVLATGCSIQ